MSKELEALKSIKGTIISSRMGDWGFEYRYVSDIESTKKHFDIIEQALKRNEPVKVKLKTHLQDMNDGETIGLCPNCNRFVKDIYKRCPDCGQAIDWSDEE